MKSIQLLDIDFKKDELTGILNTTSLTFPNKTFTVIFYNRHLKKETHLIAHITKTIHEQVHFTLPLPFIDFPELQNELGTLSISIKSEKNIKYTLLIGSRNLKSKIIYSQPFQWGNEQKMGIFTVKGSKLTFIFGNPTEVLRNKKRDKTLISNIFYNQQDCTLIFSIRDLINKDCKVILKERTSKTEWVKELHTSTGQVKVDLNSFIRTYYNQPSRWDFCLETVDSNGVILRSKLGTYDKEVASKSHRYFSSSPTEGVNVITPYLTAKNGLSIVINDPLHLVSEKLYSNLKIIEFTMKGASISGKVQLQLPEVHSYRVKSLILKYRSKTDLIEYDFPIVEEKIALTESILSFSLDISTIQFQNYYWDFYLSVDINNEYISLIRLRNPVGKVRRILSKKSIKQSFTYEDGFWVQPYITAANTVALLYKEKEEYETTSYYLKEKLAYFIYILFRWYFDRKNIWLGFEKFADSAQDNGFYFFRYCYSEKKNKNFFYIIKKDSPDYPNLQTMKDKVIYHMSFKYMLYLFSAKLLISSESKGHAYDIRVQKGLLKKALERKRQVFLQHGVIGLKRVDQIFKKTSKNAVDLFVVSSDHEKEIIEKNFGYKDEEIIVTGLSRWDVLIDKSAGQSTILLMPTWRVWMDDLPEEKFMQSEYYVQYATLLTSPVLEKTLDQYNISLNFFIHPKFKAYIGKFSTNNRRIKIYEFGEVQLNELLMQSSLLITDYSSVSWDMYYQKKPVIFYQFDLDDYMKYQGSYIDMEKNLFGERANTVDRLISLIKKYADRNFLEEKQYATMRNHYLKYTDHHNSSRIYQEILNHRQQLARKKRGLFLYDSSLLRTFWAYAKKNEILFSFASYLKNILIKH